MSKELIGVSKQYNEFLKEIKSRILSARVNTARAVSRDVIKLYWDIGTIIVYRQKKH
ncbi:MAG: DUF1016 domain-containing protein, partial [Deltaproteobacteria bacterium]|nr:DUF1016 domain-containing protein [Deltaproteobacteria bacterium]